MRFACRDAGTVAACTRPAVGSASCTVPQPWHSGQRPTHFAVRQPHSAQR